MANAVHTWYRVEQIQVKSMSLAWICQGTFGGVVCTKSPGFCKTVTMSLDYIQHFIAWLAVVSSAATPSLTVLPSVPSDASSFVDPDFAGFAFEQASFVNYAQDLDGNPNVFSQNLIAAITNRTGGKPLIRLGGTR